MRGGKSLCGHGFHRTRSQILADCDARSFPSIRGQDPDASTPVRRKTLPSKLGPSQGFEDQQFVDEQQGNYQSGRFRFGEKIWGSCRCWGFNPTSGDALVSVCSIQSLPMLKLIKISEGHPKSCWALPPTQQQSTCGRSVAYLPSSYSRSPFSKLEESWNFSQCFSNFLGLRPRTLGQNILPYLWQKPFHYLLHNLINSGQNSRT